jgi:hypothetical protein
MPPTCQFLVRWAVLAKNSRLESPATSHNRPRTEEITRISPAPALRCSSASRGLLYLVFHPFGRGCISRHEDQHSRAAVKRTVRVRDQRIARADSHLSSQTGTPSASSSKASWNTNGLSAEACEMKTVFTRSPKLVRLPCRINGLSASLIKMEIVAAGAPNDPQ